MWFIFKQLIYFTSKKILNRLKISTHTYKISIHTTLHIKNSENFVYEKIIILIKKVENDKKKRKIIKKIVKKRKKIKNQ